jgi:hypothetical protein
MIRRRKMKLKKNFIITPVSKSKNKDEIDENTLIT